MPPGKARAQQAWPSRLSAWPVFCLDGNLLFSAACGRRDTLERSSFLKKRTKKLLLPRVALARIRSGKIKVFCFFFSKKKCFLSYPTDSTKCVTRT
jgi:hypothetical protein